ncbi:MAG: hypothetical protein WD041_02935 [Nitriliruptoraceae bacterium]
MDDWNPPAPGEVTQPTTSALDLRGFGMGGEISLPDEQEIVELEDLDGTAPPFPTP